MSDVSEEELSQLTWSVDIKNKQQNTDLLYDQSQHSHKVL